MRGSRTLLSVVASGWEKILAQVRDPEQSTSQNVGYCSNANGRVAVNTCHFCRSSVIIKLNPRLCLEPRQFFCPAVLIV